MATAVIPVSEAHAVVALDEAKRYIGIALDAEDVASLFELLDTMAAVQHLKRRQGIADRVALDAGEIKVRAEAALGKLDLAAVSHRGRRPSKSEVVPAPLADFQSARRSKFRTLGKLDSNQLDSVMAELRADPERGVTTVRAVRVARSLLPHEWRTGRRDSRKVTTCIERLRNVNRTLRPVREAIDSLLPEVTPAERRIIERQLVEAAQSLDELLAKVCSDTE